MDFDLQIKDNELTICCSEGLKEFAYEFIDYYKDNINDIKNKLMIKTNPKLLVVITDDEKLANFVYGKSDFSGFFNDTGAFAYINLHGTKTKDYIIKSLIHEIIHHLYKYYVYGKDKKRITWLDEGLAQYLSKQKDYQENYQEFLLDNLKDKNINLNDLNHEDKSFGNNNGYNLSYIAVRYLFEIYELKEINKIISDYDRIIEIGKTILDRAYKYYIEKN